MRIIDFGAGTGLLASHVAPLVAKVVAVDISPSTLQALADLDSEDGRTYSLSLVTARARAAS